jgi:hypothetical protein
MKQSSSREVNSSSGSKNILIVLMMEAVSTSETSVNFYQTTRLNITEDCHLQEVFSFYGTRKLIALFTSAR